MEAKKKADVMEAMKPVCIYTAGDRVEAEMLLEALQKNQIQGYREASGSGGVMDVYAGNSIYGEKIYVDELDAEKAKNIIDAVMQEAELEVKAEDEISSDTKRYPAWVQIGLIIVLILLFGAIVFGVISSVIS
nr:DUF2007 domain-containing protein [uncultured Sellimonas sp.]